MYKSVKDCHSCSPCLCTYNNTNFKCFIGTMANITAGYFCDGHVCENDVFGNGTHFTNSTSSVGFGEDDDILNNMFVRALIIFLYSAVIIFGVFANSVILCVLLRDRHRKITTNVFIIGLATSDILLCVFNLPLQLHYQLSNQWAFGGTLCRVFMPTYAVPVFVSSMSILMIAVDRYMRIVHPLRQHLSSYAAVLILMSIAGFIVFLSIPVILQTQYKIVSIPELNIHQTYCVEIWTSLSLRHAYTVMTICLQFFVPLLASTYLYVKISSARKRKLSFRQSDLRNRRRTNRILIAIVLLFFVCWLPWNLFALTLEFKPLLFPTEYIKLCDLLLKIVAMSSACINPFLYGWLNGNFRRGLPASFYGSIALKPSRSTRMSNVCPESPV